MRAPLLLVVISFAAAQTVPSGSIRGIVVNAEQAPIPGALVRAEPQGYQIATSADGRFTFSSLPLSRITLTVVAKGFFSGFRTEIDLSENATAEAQIVLRREAVLEQSIVVTGSGTQALVMEAPVRTELLSQSFVQAQAARNLAEALTATVPGVRIENNCQNCGWTAVRLNGLEGPYTQILEDGLPTVSGASMVYALDQLPTEFFENIEVVKGGASSLYGPNAVAGVINLVRREPQEKRVQLDVQSGGYAGRPEHSGGLIAQLDRLGNRWSADVYYRGLRRTHTDLDRDGFTELTRRASNGGGGTAFGRFLEGRARLTAGASTIDDFRRGGSDLDVPPEQTAITEQVHSSRSAAFARWNHSPDALFYYNLSSSFSYLRRNSYYGAGFDPNAYGATSNPLWTSDASAGYQAGRHTLSAGVQHWHERISDVYVGYGRETRQTFRNSGVYVQDEWRINRRLTLLGGFRTDKSNLLDRWVLSPRGNLRFGINDSFSLRVGVSSGFRPPQVFDEDLHIAAVAGEAMLVRFARGLRPETSRSFSAAADFSRRVAGGSLQLGVNVFWTRLHDVFQLREAESVQGDRILERTNGPGSRFRGVEMSGQWRPNSHLAFRAGGTAQQARYKQPEPLFGSTNYFRNPSRYGFAGVDVTLPFDVDVLNSFEFTGSMLVPHFAGFIHEDRLERSPTFHVWSSIVSRTWSIGESERRSVRLYVRGSNLLGSFQSDFDRGPQRDSTYVYGPMMPRGVVAGMTVRF